MVFGVFDGLHPGHHYFLSEAAKKCEELVVAVTLSEVVSLLKGKFPKYDYHERVREITKFNPQLKITPGDLTLGEWNVLKEHQPNIIFLGYDQQGIARELEKLNKPFIFLPAYHPEKYKSSLMGI